MRRSLGTKVKLGSSITLLKIEGGMGLKSLNQFTSLLPKMYKQQILNYGAKTMTLYAAQSDSVTIPPPHLS